MSQCAPTVLFLFHELPLLNQLNSEGPVVVVVVVVVVPASLLKVADHGTMHQFSQTLLVCCYCHSLRQSFTGATYHHRPHLLAFF